MLRIRALILAATVLTPALGHQTAKADDGLIIAAGVLQGLANAMGGNPGYMPPNQFQPHPYPAYQPNPVVGGNMNRFNTYNPYTGGVNYHNNFNHYHSSAFSPTRNTYVPGTRSQTQRTWYDARGNRYSQNTYQWRNGVTGQPHWRNTVRRTDTRGNTTSSTGFGLR